MFRRLLLKLLIFAAAGLFTAAFFINWCNWIYGCGCRSWWAGAAAHCNIQQPGPPDCPWCVHSDLAATALFTTLAVQALVGFWPGRLRWWRLPIALAASPLTAGAIGWVIGRMTGYWS